MTNNNDTGGLGNYWKPPERIDKTIERVKELDKKRTPAPWETNYTGNIWGDIDNPEHDGDSPLIAQTSESEQAAEANFIVATANSIMPIISEVERLKAELETTQTRLVQAEKDDCSRIDVIADLRAELSKAQEKIKELQEYKDAVIKAKPGLLKLEKIIKDM